MNISGGTLKSACAKLATLMLVAASFVGVTPLAANAAETTQSTAACTITGTAGDDVLTGTAGDDVICGLAGNDTISGGAGNDIVLGGLGNDTLVGGDGADTLDYSQVIYDLSANLARGRVYGQGSDVVSGFENVIGGSGDDNLVGDDLNNQLLGGPGDDSFFGGGAINLIDGGAGADTANYATLGTFVTISLASGTASVVATGSVPNSTDAFASMENVTGSSFADNITGDVGANLLAGGGGADIVAGGAGDDTILGGAGDDNLTGGDGKDTLSFAGAQVGVTAALSAGTATGEGSDALAGFENLVGGSGNDTLTGDAGSNSLVGGAGNDALAGGDGMDVADFSSSSAAVTVNLLVGTATGAGSDTLATIETVIGSAYNDVLAGDASANVLTGGAGNDNILGGGGVDAAVFAADASVAIDMSVDLSTGLATGEGSDFLLDIENVVTGAGNDVLVGNSDANVFSSGTGNDVLTGGAGNDTLQCGGQAGDTLSFASSTDALAVNLANAMSSGSLSGNDTLAGCKNVVGGAGNDVLYGDNGINRLSGGAGNDVLVGGAGDDSLVGGAGNDTLTGSAGIDAVDYSDSVSAVFVSLTTMKATGAGSDTLREVENIVGGAGNDVLVGSAGANTIWGGNGDDNIDGAAGIDTVSYSGVSGAISISLAQKKARGEGNDKVSRIENVIGGLGDDSLVGDATSNRLDGGAGNDVVIGGAGNDALVGGAGSDTASFTDSAKAITANLATGKATGIGADSMLTIENLVGGAGNDVLTGNLDANRIDGGNGKDKLVGGAGNDVLVGGLGDDNLAGGDGIDIADFSAGFAAVRANLATGKASGWAGNDALAGLEGLIGGSAADLLIGNDSDNRIVGNGGDDNISGADGNDVLDGGYGNDLLVGGNGVDEVTFAGSMIAVNASLTANTSTGMGSDSLNGIENLTGGDGADVLIGNASDNALVGAGGNDLLLGMAGNDALFGGAGNDRLDGGDGVDASDGEAGRNICRSSSTAGDSATNCPFSVEFDVTEARYVTGTFTDALGNGVGLTSVTLFTKQGASVASTNTDIRGNFSFVAQTGNYDLTFETGSDKSLDGLPSMFKVVADVRVSVDTALAIKTPSALKLLASVFDSNGEPVSGAALFTDYFYASGTWQVAAGINGLVSTQLGGAAAVTNSNGQVELSVFATAPNNPMTLRAVWIDAQQQTHSGFVVLTVVADRSVSIDLG